MTTATGDPSTDAAGLHAPPHAPPVAPTGTPGTRPQLLRAGGAVHRWAAEFLGMDYRSLALMRICMGALLMWVAYSHGIEARIFYSDAGVLPRSSVLGSEAFPSFSLHFANGGMPYITALFILQFVVACMMTVGYRSRLATIGSYILLLSMQNRHQVLLFGADIVLRVSLFWAMFLPLGERYSIDRLLGRATRATNRPYLGAAGIAFFVQFASIYVVTSLMKYGTVWQVDHTAVSFALALDVYGRPLGHWLAQYPTLTRWLTISTLYVEFYGPFLFIFPIFTRWTRLLAFLMFAGLQIGFGLCMFLGIFGWVMIAIMLPFLPAMFWDRIMEPLARKAAQRLSGLGSRARRRLHGIVSPWQRWVQREQARSALATPLFPAPVSRAGRWGWNLLWGGAVLYLMALTLMWNAGEVIKSDIQSLPQLQADLRITADQAAARQTALFARQKKLEAIKKYWVHGDSFLPVMYALGLNQIWDMFAPKPQDMDGWFVVTGTKWNGDTVNLITGESPVSYDKPAYVAGTYRNQLWMSFLISFWTDGASDKEAFAAYIGDQWNQSHTGDDRLQTVEINEMLEYVGTGPDKQPIKSEVQRVPLWTEWFYR